MKKALFFLFVFCSINVLFAQSPGSFNYQTVIRDANGELISNQELSFRISIIAESATSDPIYTENHAVQTNEFGVCNLKIGTGTNPTTNFNLIDWSNGNYYLKIELDVDAGSAYKDLGTIQLLSVPFSMHSNTASLAKVIDNEVLYFSDSDTLFAVKDREGNIVFAVFPDGAELYVNETVKGKVGGFAISGRSPNKGIDEDYFVVTADSTRVYVNQDQTKGKVGGFAISGRSPNKESINNFMDLTPENYFIGHGSGSVLTEGIYNSVLGFESGKNLTLGSSNAFIGYQSGFNTQNGSGNLFLGYQTGYSNLSGSYNTFLGYQAGLSNTTGVNNSFLGSFTGNSNISGSYNTFIGDSTGFNNTSGDNNTFVGTKVGFNNDIGWANLFIGNYAGFSNEGGFENIFLGDHSGYSNRASGMNVAIGVRSGFYSESGWNNVYLGTETGYSNIDGEGNVFIGYQTGMNNTHGTRNIFIGNRAGLDQQGSDKLIIDNKDEDSTSTFIWGDLLADHLRINAHVGIGAQPGYYSLSVYEASNPAIINLMGVGNAYDYAQIKLEADIGTDTLGYQLIHDIDNRFRLFYNDGTNLYPRIGVDVTGKVMIGGAWEDATEMLDVDGNARFRQVGTGTSVNDLGITSDGTLTTVTSDKRLKNNIVPLENSLEKVLKLNGYTFDWKSKEENKSDVGLIAQEVLEIFPEAVFKNPNDGYYGINYSRFPALFVEAFKEQNKSIEQQKLQIEQLQKENQELKQKIDEIMKLLKDL